jgi:hypothetical protein
MDPMIEAKAAYELQSVDSALDVMRAAMYSNPNLSRLVRECPGYTSAAMHMLRVGIDNPDTAMVRRSLLALSRDRILLAQATPIGQEPTPVSTAKDEALAERIRVYAQGVLDQYKASDYWSPGQHAQLEATLYLSLIEPLISSGVVSTGSITVGLGPHPVTGAHHSLIVGRVELVSI